MSDFLWAIQTEDGHFALLSEEYVETVQTSPDAFLGATLLSREIIPGIQTHWRPVTLSL